MKQLKKISQAGLILTSFILFFSSCSTFKLSSAETDTNNLNRNQGLALKAGWVRDTLSKENIGFRKVNRMSPILYKNKVVFGNALDGLVAYEQATGQKLWRLDIPYGIEASGAVIRDRLFVGSNNGKMYSVDLSQGSIVWTFDTQSESVAEPLLNEGVLYFISGNQSVFALDAATGKQLWTYNRQDTANLMTVRGGSKPALSNGILYVGFSDGSLVSFNAKTGTQQWEISLNKNIRFKDIDSSPVIDGDLIFVSSYDDKLYCLSKNKGEILWSLVGGGVSTPVVVGEYLYYGTSKSELLSVNKKTGALVWKYKSNNGIMTDPVVYKGFIAAGESQGSLILLDLLTGAKKTSFEPGRGVFSRPTVQESQNKFYFISGEGNAYSVQAEPILDASIYYLKN